MQSSLLLTGFGPFLDVTVNPSGAVVERLDGMQLGSGMVVSGHVIPVSFGRAPGAVAEAAAGLPAPLAAVVSLGVHRGPEFRLEGRAGVHYASAQPDNDGQVGVPGALDGPEWLRTSLDLSRCEAWLAEAGAAATVQSEDAGGYLCERVFRAGLELVEGTAAPALFLHVPPIESVPVEEQLPVVEGFLRRLAAELG